MDLRRLRKVELHRHLEGSIRYRTVCDIHGRIPPKQHHFVRGERRGWKPFFDKFLILRTLNFTKEQILRIAREAVEDAAKDGIEYLELRFSPVFWSLRSGLKPHDIGRWIVGAARREAKKRRMHVRFIATLQRQRGPALNAPSVDVAIENRPWFVGLDVAGDERTHADLRDFKSLFRKADRGGLRLTIHAGEGGGPRNVRDAIMKWGADRIGHGTSVIRDPRVLDMAMRRGVAFEMCPTSNRDTGVWKDRRRHPIARLLRAGALVTLNTDDPAVSAIDLTHECRIARREMKLTNEELIRLQDNASEAAFATIRRT